MRRRLHLRALIWLCVLVAAALVSGCRGRKDTAQPQTALVSKGQAQRLAVYVEGPPKVIVIGDEECFDWIKKSEKLYEAAMRDALTKAGFVVVDSSSKDHHLVAVIKGGLRKCSFKEGGDTRVWGKFIAYLNGRESGSAVAKGAQEADGDGFAALTVRLTDDLLESRDLVAMASEATPVKSDSPAGTAVAGGTPAEPAGLPPAAAPGTYKSGGDQRSAFALIVGIENYDGFPSPDGARADARAFAQLAQASLGIPKDNIRLLIDGKATRTTIQKEIRWMKNNMAQRGRVYFYFSGHGAPDPTSGVAYLLPADGDPAALDVTGLKLDALMKDLADTGADEVVAFVDSCFSGSGGRSVLPKGVRPLVRVKKVAPKAKVSLFTAASGDEIAGPAKGQKHGLLTHFLLEGIGSARADIDGDGDVTVEELAGWVTPRVKREAKRDNRAQTPQLVGTGTAVVATGLQ
ncbi:MAG: caspase family protein [Deltaproteobacteria bacterium]|nr:caspase family protein [Deltaproteobacteria bacterium]